MAKALSKDKRLLRKVWQALNDMSADELLSNGRVYGGGLHKLEPRELGNVDASSIVKLSKVLRSEFGVVQPDLFAVT
jgi:adenine-specific DNA-methyltransferase